MEEQVFYDIRWNKKNIGLNKLVRGRVYVTPKKGVLMYLGLAKDGQHTFYRFAIPDITSYDHIVDRERNINTPYATFANYDAQVAGIRRIMEISIDTCACKECIVQFKNNPGIIGEFPCGHYENRYFTWYQSSFPDGGVPVIGKGKMNTNYVRAKELVLGGLYYGDGAYPSVFCYLGRKTNGFFVWCEMNQVTWRVWEEVQTGTETLKLFYTYAEVTKQNKKLKPIALAAEDDNVKNLEVKALAERNIAIDLYNVTQEIINNGGFSRRTTIWR